MRPYWTFKVYLAVIDGIIMNGTHLIILKKLALELLHINYLGIEKTGLLAHESICRINMKADIENTEELFYMSWFSGGAAQRKNHSP